MDGGTVVPTLGDPVSTVSCLVLLLAKSLGSVGGDRAGRFPLATAEGTGVDGPNMLDFQGILS